MTLLNPFFGEFGGMYVPQTYIPDHHCASLI